jgi:hypothetical protein
MNRKQRRAAHLPKLTPKQVAKLRSQGNITAYPVRTTKLVRQMFGADADQLAADIAAMALKGGTPEGWRHGFEAVVEIGSPSKARFRVAVDMNKSVRIGFDHDPEYDDALSFVDDAGNVIKDDAGNPVTPEAAFTTILPVENEDTEIMLRELRPTEVWEVRQHVDAEGEVQQAMAPVPTDWAWLSDVHHEGFDPDGVLGPTYYRITDTHYYSVFLKPRPPGNPVLLMTKVSEEVAEAIAAGRSEYSKAIMETARRRHSSTDRARAR